MLVKPKLDETLTGYYAMARRNTLGLASNYALNPPVWFYTHDKKKYFTSTKSSPVEEQVPADKYDMPSLKKLEFSELQELCDKIPFSNELKHKHDALSCRCRIYRKKHPEKFGKFSRRRLIERFIRESERCARS